MDERIKYGEVGSFDGPCQGMPATKRTNTSPTAELMHEVYWEKGRRIVKEQKADSECGREEGRQIDREARENCDRGTLLRGTWVT